VADQSDVEIALTALITATIFPNGVGAGPIAAVGNVLVDIRRGWPLPATLDIALAAGTDVLVRIYPEPGMTRNTSRFTLQWRDTVHMPPTLTASVTGSTVTFGGTGDASHVAGVMVGSPPFGMTFAYRLLPSDGPADVATAFKALIGGSTGAAGNVLTILTNLPVIARVVNDQGAFLETRRQDQGFRVSIWSANNVARDAVASAIDSALAYLVDPNGNPWMNLILPIDNSAGWLRYRATYNLDNSEKAGLYRRDLCYLCEYPTSLVQQFSEVLFEIVTLTPDLNTPGTVPQVVTAPVTTLTF
jgi:hypothetical protein